MPLLIVNAPEVSTVLRAQDFKNLKYFQRSYNSVHVGIRLYLDIVTGSQEDSSAGDHECCHKLSTYFRLNKSGEVTN